MTITARSAFSKSAQFYAHNWRDVLLLTAKTFMIILIANFALAGLVDLIFGTHVVSVIKEDYGWFSSSVQPPISAFHLSLINDVIQDLTYACFIPPLIVSINRSIILKETFNRIFFKQLTEKRSLKLILLMIIVSILSGPLIATSYALSTGEDILPKWTPLIALFLCIPTFYILCRLYYLEPVLSVDRQFSTIPQIWQATRGKAWVMFKLLFLIVLGTLGLVILNYFFGSSLTLTGQEVTFNILNIQLLMLILTPLLIGAVAFIYKAIEKEE